MRDFTFQGKSAQSYGIVIESIARTLLAGRRDTRITIPQRDGRIETGGYMAYEGIQISVSCGFLADNKEKRQTKAREIAYWLSGAGNLIFSDEPDKYYKAVVISPINLETLLSVGKFSAVFDCYPFAFGKTVDERFGESYAPHYKGTASTPTMISIHNAGENPAVGIQIQIRKRVI